MTINGPVNFMYWAYQLNIRANFPIPEFPAGDQTSAPDVCIRLAAIPDAPVNVPDHSAFYQITPNRFLLTLPTVARYLVRNGNEILVEPALNGLESDIRIFLLGSAMGALLHQRGMLVIHAGALLTERGAVLFTGPSGIGKSTLLGELMRRGYRLMVDDVCGVILDSNGAPLVLPGYPRTRLWMDSAQKLEQDIKTMERTRPGLEKFERQATEQYWEQPAPLRRIYLLSTGDGDEISLTPEPRLNTFRIILNNTYRRQFLGGLEMRAPHFNLVSAVAKHTGVTHVTRPAHSFRLSELADLIEQDLS
jgi:hypothetical protein